MKNHRFNITLLFTLTVFAIMVSSAAIIGTILFGTYELGVIRNINPYDLIVIFAFASVILGLFLSHIIGKIFLRSINEINNATKAISNGDFTFRLNENRTIKEIQEMSHNFNMMAKELQNTELFRDDFIKNVSHEIKTPLSTIEGYATLLQNEQLDEKTRHQYLHKIIKNTHRLSSLTSNILLLSKIENQEITHDFCLFSLDEQIRECILSQETLWSKKGIQFELDLDFINYYGNETLLPHVWNNILSNAIKFSHEKGYIDILLKQKKNNIFVIITDYGSGMNEEVKNRIFEKFYQGDTSHKSIGNGLGMTLAQRIVNIHHGNIEVDSTEGKGTTFTVTLPIKQI